MQKVLKEREVIFHSPFLVTHVDLLCKSGILFFLIFTLVNFELHIFVLELKSAPKGGAAFEKLKLRRPSSANFQCGVC